MVPRASVSTILPRRRAARCSFLLLPPVAQLHILTLHLVQVPGKNIQTLRGHSFLPEGLVHRFSATVLLLLCIVRVTRDIS
ncbi:hypothetical protein PI125_g23057 [Phytophthora idaei]|nr:hypothetical protein PI125_g23057 [Phytophthora idaei]